MIRSARRAIGGTPPAFEGSPHFAGGTFHNTLPSAMISDDARSSLMLDAARRTRVAAPTVRVARAPLPESAADCAATWLGHSTVLVEIAGHWVLTDPVFSQRVSTSQRVGPKRLHPVPLPIDELPQLDAVVISHDHYDHLDTPSIDALATTGVCFVVPLGIGAHLRAWGVSEDQIVELDWGQSHRINGMELGCVEARHFSGRLFSRNQTLWSAWTITAGQRRVLFGGDTGYTPAFKELDPGFDLTMMPIGAYDRRWADIHMDPAEAVQAHRDVEGGVLLPIHWATFNLAFHAWSDPIEWVRREAAEHSVALATPRPGQRFELDDLPTRRWWAE